MNEKSNEVAQPDLQSSPTQLDEQLKQSDYDYQKYINQRLDQVHKKEILILKPMNS